MFSIFNKPQPPREDGPPAPVRTLVAWNANSLHTRIERNRAEVSNFLKSHTPDVVFISEVRFPAAGGPFKKDDGKPRTRGALSSATAQLATEAAAIKTFVETHGYRSYWSLSDSKYAGTGLLVRRACEQPTSVRYSLDDGAAAGTHHPEGRVILASFSSFECLGTCTPPRVHSCARPARSLCTPSHLADPTLIHGGSDVPNNQTKEEGQERRRAWDAQMSRFVQRQRDKPLVWLGDLNVAAEWADVGPDPTWFREKNGQEAASSADRGQPGFTANEQLRFGEIRAAGKLVRRRPPLDATPPTLDTAR
jgi:exonuclease III